MEELEIKGDASCASVLVTWSPAQLMELVQTSGAPLLVCKKALVVSNGDLAKARSTLSTGAWKYGLLIN